MEEGDGDNYGNDNRDEHPIGGVADEIPRIEFRGVRGFFQQRPAPMQWAIGSIVEVFFI